MDMIIKHEERKAAATLKKVKGGPFAKSKKVISKIY